MLCFKDAGAGASFLPFGAPLARGDAIRTTCEIENAVRLLLRYFPPSGSQVGDCYNLRAPLPSERVLTARLEYPDVSLNRLRRLAKEGVLDDYKVELRAAVGPRFKLIEATDQGGQLVREEVFDLLEDPDETTPLDPALVGGGVVEALRAALRKGQVRAEGPDAQPLDEMDEDVLEGLRALGYVP